MRAVNGIINEISVVISFISKEFLQKLKYIYQIGFNCICIIILSMKRIFKSIPLIICGIVATWAQLIDFSAMSENDKITTKRRVYKLSLHLLLMYSLTRKARNYSLCTAYTVGIWHYSYMLLTARKENGDPTGFVWRIVCVASCMLVTKIYDDIDIRNAIKN